MPKANSPEALGEALRAIFAQPDVVQRFAEYLKSLPASTTVDIADPHTCYLCKWLRKQTGCAVTVTNIHVYAPFGDADDSAELPEALRDWYQELAVREPGAPPVFRVSAARAAKVLERILER